ncbi:MAG: dUTP diphosphatase [Clostridia bacterium]|nr:dUTP diphosphatase [Clostridia bacterium]
MPHSLPVRIRLVRPGASVPRYATAGAAACDLCAVLDAPLILKRGASVSVPTGIAISMGESGYVAIVAARSGLAFKHGLSLVNGIGVIDEDYRGEICVGLRNDGPADYEISPGERIAQLMFLPYASAVFAAAETLDETARGEGGFGSTGKQ